ncbi:MAG: hypothetical protein Q9191_003500 [Dirinaria sp. TL-2023a]
MEGSSPFPYQSPSYHSSSYLPKLEANFMKDFRCCGITLPSTHELLQHYEENHAQQMPASRKTSAQTNADSRKTSIANTVPAAQGRVAQTEPNSVSSIPAQSSAAHQSSTVPVIAQNHTQPTENVSAGLASQVPTAQDIDGLQDMEMDMDDDSTAPATNTQQPEYPVQSQPRMTQRSQFGQPSSTRVPPLDLNAMNMGSQFQQHQGLRNSTPSTPIAPGRSAQFYQNNPTVSSVNTPTLSAHPRQQQQRYTPDSSAPGTPGELNPEFLGNYGNLNMSNQNFLPNQFNGFGGYYDYANGNDMLDLCIDEPAKRLFQHNGGQKPPKQSQTASSSQLGDGQYSENSELARTIREQQRAAGVPDPPTENGVPKPFHCPVIGCEKAYKNQNGLKYHKAHGHNTQQLTANDNGTFSIVDPETLSPYPGTLGMEKHKPYRCDSCGKRYKNLNGLKYHKNHSPQCDNDSQIRPNQTSNAPNMPSTIMPGAGLSELGDEMQL